MYWFGWWTTGRDKAAVDLFRTVLRAIDQGEIKGGIAYTFLSRERGESQYSDEIIDISEKRDIPWKAISAVHFCPELRKDKRKLWRTKYHERVLEVVAPYRADLVILAGYMWVVSPEACRRLRLLNLHPALPGGPQGTWQEVIWRLLELDARRTGAMMHLVTPELDKGPPVTYVSFPIKGRDWDELWRDFKKRLEAAGSLNVLKRTIGENLLLFKRIREEGVKRELPLIKKTMAAFSRGEVDLEDLSIPVELKVP